MTGFDSKRKVAQAKLDDETHWDVDEDNPDSLAKHPAFRATQEQKAEPVAWQPIETAPKDGNAILVMRDIWPGTKSGRAEECNGHNTYVAAWWGDENNGRGAWVCYMDSVCEPQCPIEPTHWMPLPCPPSIAPPQQQAEPVTREGFEKWAKFAAPYMDISRFEDGYSDCNTDYAWTGWKAALAQPQQQAEPVKQRTDGMPTSKTERDLRRMLCIERHGGSAYMDDGEASFCGDKYCRSIDYMRESIESIRQAWYDAGVKRLSGAQPEQQAEPVQERITHITWDERGVRTVNGIPDDSPQRKELFASEILNMMPSTIPAEYDGPLMQFARDLEAKLKERNGY